MSFHEKSAWACLVAIVTVFVPYFAFAFTGSGDRKIFEDTILVLAVSLGLATILALVHIAFAVSSAQVRKTGDVPAPDEREVAIEMRSSKTASWVLGAVVLLWCLAAYVGIPAGSISELAAATETPANLRHLAVPSSQALFFVHLLFAGFVLANVIYYASMVIGYRRGV